MSILPNSTIDERGKEWRIMVFRGFRKKSMVEMTGFAGIRTLILSFDPFYFPI